MFNLSHSACNDDSNHLINRCELPQAVIHMKEPENYNCKNNVYWKILDKSVEILCIDLCKMKIKAQQERRQTGDANAYNVKQYEEDSSNP